MQNVSSRDDDVIEIDLLEIADLLWHRAWLIVMCMIAGAVLGFGISRFLITEQFESTTKVYILNKNDNNTLTYSDVQLGSQLTKDYAVLIKSRDVLEQVMEDCGLSESYGAFSKRVNVETLSDTRIIAITVTDPMPVNAQILANRIREVAADHIKNVTDVQAVNVAEEANLPESPASPNVFKWTAISALLGAFLCAVVILVHFMLDDTIKTSDDVEKYLGLSTLGMIPMKEEPEKYKRSPRKYRKEPEEGKGMNEVAIVELDMNENAEEASKCRQ